MYTFRGLLVLLVVVKIASGETVFMIWAVFAGRFLGRIGGATTFASPKVKDALGRIGIF